MITLPDGRRLNWHEFGDPGGFPVIYTAGTPESGLAGACFDAPAREAGLRWISPDKPGYGKSDSQRVRFLTDWADDVAALAGHLGLDRFALAGESGGAPSTLAAAYKLADRVPLVVLIAPMGPIGAAGMKASNQVLFWVARHAPSLNALLLVPLAAALRDPGRRARYAGRSPSHQDEARLRLDAAADAFRGGTRGCSQELALLSRPWGFPLAEIKTPVHLWHGARDRNVPIAAAECLAAELPAAVAHFSASSGHGVGLDRRFELISVLASAARDA